MTTDEIRAEISEGLKNGFTSIEGRLIEAEEWRGTMTRIIDRQTTILLGDPNIKHKGLLDIVQEHQAFIERQNTAASEAKGSRRVYLWMAGLAGGGIATFIQGLVQYFSSRGH